MKRIVVAIGEQSVGALEKQVGLSQSALSQHLGRLRRDKLVATRRARSARSASRMASTGPDSTVRSGAFWAATWLAIMPSDIGRRPKGVARVRRRLRGRLLGFRLGRRW